MPRRTWTSFERTVCGRVKNTSAGGWWERGIRASCEAAFPQPSAPPSTRRLASSRRTAPADFGLEHDHRPGDRDRDDQPVTAAKRARPSSPASGGQEAAHCAATRTTNATQRAGSGAAATTRHARSDSASPATDGSATSATKAIVFARPDALLKTTQRYALITPAASTRPQEHAGPEPPRDQRLARVARRPAHHVRLRRVADQCHRRQDVGDQVHPQDLQGQQRRGSPRRDRGEDRRISERLHETRKRTTLRRLPWMTRPSFTAPRWS